MAWTRADCTDYPKIYAEFEGRKVDQNGKRRRYWVQDLTEDMMDGFVEEFSSGFLRDEIIARYTKVYESEEVINGFKQFHKDNVKNKVSLVCLTKDDQGAIKVAGLNAMHVKSKGDKDEVTGAAEGLKLVKIIKYLYSQVDVFETLKTDKYMNAVGLYVFPEFRGEGVGQEILNARKLICDHLGIKHSVTFFTSYVSQGMAEKAGFKDMFAIDYDKFPEEMIVPNLHEHTKAARLMYITYP